MESIKNRTEKSENYKLYMLEGIACLLVITIHIGYQGNVGIIINVLARFAVPLFFVVSGFYLVNIDENTIPRLNCKLFKILKLCLGATILYWCWGTILHCFILREVSFLTWMKSLFSVKNIFGWIFMNSVPGAGHLWFLFALLYSYLVLKILYKVGKCKWIQLFPGILFITVLLPYCSILYSRLAGCEMNLPISLFRNWLFMGLPFVSIGIYIKKYFGKIYKINSKIFITFSLIGLSMSYVERLVVHKNMELYF